jgi:WD40 repeat protein
MKTMQKIVISIVVLITGCTPTAMPSQVGGEGVSTLLPSNSTATVIVPTVTSTFLPTSTIETNIGNDCFETLDKVPDDKTGTGVVILENRKILNGRIAPGFFLLNLETGESIDLEKPNEGLSGGFVSPDRTMMSAEFVAFEIKDNNYIILDEELLIMTADGAIQKRLPIENGAVSSAVWLDNQHLIFDISGLDSEESRGVKPSTLLVMNPFTGERKTLKADFPEMYDGYPPPFWGEPWGYSLSVYNQILSHVVYLSEGGYTYVLWDIQQKKEITRFLHWNIANHEQPRWSPDGSKFVISAYFGDISLWPQPADGLFLIDVEGNVSKLLNTNKDIFIYDHFWSPSGRYIALLQGLPDAGIQKKRLLVLDTQTSQVVDTCIEYRSLIQNDIPIWSPDETQILLYDNTEDGSDVILVDLVKRIAFQIAEDMESKGWMKSP